MVEEERFYAWLDGELASDEAARIEALVAADPELSRLATEHRAIALGLRSAFAGISATPLPERLRSALEHDGNVVSFVQARGAREGRRAPSLWAQAAALAATLAIGVFAGNVMTGGLMGSGSSSPIQADDGRLVASAGLEYALYAQLASAPAKSGPRIGLTFRDKTGAICRTFEDQASSGLACREGGDWRIRSLFQRAEGQAADYRMASGGSSQLMEAVDASIDGEPFDAAQERAAMARGWK